MPGEREGQGGGQFDCCHLNFFNPIRLGGPEAGIPKFTAAIQKPLTL